MINTRKLNKHMLALEEHLPEAGIASVSHLESLQKEIRRLQGQVIEPLIISARSAWPENAWAEKLEAQFRRNGILPLAKVRALIGIANHDEYYSNENRAKIAAEWKDYEAERWCTEPKEIIEAAIQSAIESAPEDKNKIFAVGVQDYFLKTGHVSHLQLGGLQPRC